jgi:hypothetical protein
MISRMMSMSGIKGPSDALLVGDDSYNNLGSAGGIIATWGGAGLVTNGNGISGNGYLNCPYGYNQNPGWYTSSLPEYILGTKDFTIDFWYNGGISSESQRPFIGTGWWFTTGNNGFNASAGISTGTVGDNWGPNLIGGPALPRYIWTHISFSRRLGMLYLHFDGILVGSVNIGVNGTIETAGATTGTFSGYNVNYTSFVIDEIRVHVGESLRSSANFIPIPWNSDPHNFIWSNINPADEGTSITISTRTFGYTPGTTLYYSLVGTNITANDFVDGSLTGSFTTPVLNSSPYGSFTKTLKADTVIEGPEAFTPLIYTDVELTQQVTFASNLSQQITDSSQNDPYIANVVLLLHGEGANGSLPVDSRGICTLTKFAPAAISTAGYKFGSSSLGGGTATTGYYQVTDNPSLTVGANNYTVEMWVYHTTVGYSVRLVTLKSNAAGYSSVGVNITATNAIQTFASSNGTTWQLNITSAVNIISAGNWYHMAVVRNGNTITTYYNGTAVTSGAFTGTGVAGIYTRFLASSVSVSGLNGFLDEIRITNGVARYTANFTPPERQFPDV